MSHQTLSLMLPTGRGTVEQIEQMGCLILGKVFTELHREWQYVNMYVHNQGETPCLQCCA
jgi:hypothetical protein